jgi:glucosamine--fructose-6-phosphate aminotransferase (isomerizing)
MCGIFGLTVSDKHSWKSETLTSVVKSLFLMSESRGKEAAGLSILTGGTIFVYKDAKPASSLVRDREYKNLLDRILRINSSSDNSQDSHPVAFIGHSRLVTNGTHELHQNNQPVTTGGVVGVHNGIIVNQNSLWKQYPEMKRQYQVDSEVIFSLIRMFHQKGITIGEATQRTFYAIQGMASVAVLFDDLDHLLLATNNGSLYQCVTEMEALFIFASERFILEQLTTKRSIRKILGPYNISQVPPGAARLINIKDLSIKEFSLDPNVFGHVQVKRNETLRRIHDVLPEPNGKAGPITGNTAIRARKLAAIAERFPYDKTAKDRFRHCTRCILPETMPFIEFDNEGVCNFCRNYSKLEFYGKGALEEAIAPFRSKNGAPDCIVGLSGGRDSTYALHYVKTVLKMNPVAYTYDWGMVTDLARRNISRVCGKLGIEHLLVSADIAKKREYIRKNVRAWLKRPSLGMIPLFMAGDKQYFYFAQQLKRQTGTKLVILGENMLERTDFKTGFAKARPAVDTHHVYTLPTIDKMRVAMFYGREYLLNPSYINASIFDTLFAFFCYYFIERSYINLYKYIPWNEKEIISTLREDYDWEIATDTTSTWRIGDATASFYNYIYLIMAGFTENDTFRSNQIREGIITREEALKLVEKENEPRYQSIQWYCDIIGSDFEGTIKRINMAPKLYPWN